MQPHKKFAFDVGITFFASVVAMPLGFIITILLGRYLGAGDLGLYRMTPTPYGIAMLVAAIGIPESDDQVCGFWNGKDGRWLYSR